LDLDGLCHLCRLVYDDGLVGPVYDDGLVGPVIGHGHARRGHPPPVLSGACLSRSGSQPSRIMALCTDCSSSPVRPGAVLAVMFSSEATMSSRRSVSHWRSKAIFCASLRSAACRMSSGRRKIFETSVSASSKRVCGMAPSPSQTALER